MNDTNETTPRPLAHAQSLIGVFDSGVGGLSVLQALRVHVDDERFIYVADSAYAPYGERDEEDVRARSHRICETLVDMGAQLIVVACNTATAAAIESLRARWPGIPFVGVEPGLKPAVGLSQGGRVGVMATRATLRSDRFHRLLREFGAAAEAVLLQPCDGLAHAIERHAPDAQEIRELVERHTAPLREAHVDTVVLGCTHYPLVVDLISRALGPDVTLLDTAQAVARQTRRLLGDTQVKETRSPSSQPLRALTSGDAMQLERFARTWLGMDLKAQLLKERCSAERHMVPETGIEPVRPLSRAGGF